MYNEIELKAICLWCGAANLLSGLECRKCGAPLTEQPKQQAIIYEPSPGGLQPDDISAFEAKAVFNSKWIKQTITYNLNHTRQEEYYIDIPRAGILTKLRIVFLNEEVDSAWRFILEMNGCIALLDRPNIEGKVDEIRHLVDTELAHNLRLRIKRDGSYRSQPRRIEMTRWTPVAV